MRDFLLRVIVYAVAIAATARILPGITIPEPSLSTYLMLGLIFGIVNALLKPLIQLLTCPLVILTLGLFIFIINGIMLSVTASLAGDSLMIDGFWTAVFGGIIMSVVSMIMESLLGIRKDPHADYEHERNIPKRG